MRYTLFFAVLLQLAGLSAQPGEPVRFRGRIVHLETNRPLSGLQVSAPGASEALTDDEGFFTLSLPPGTTEFTLEVASADWAVHFPRQGRAAVPRSPQTPVEFLVKKLRSEHAALRAQVARLKREGRLKDNQLDSLQQILRDTVLAMEKRFEKDKESKSDALQVVARQKAELEQRLAELSARLEAGYLKRNREEVYDSLSRELLVFVDKLKDLRDKLQPAFMRTVTLSPQSLEQLRQATEAYNRARNALYNAHGSRLQQVELYWERDLLTYQLAEIYQLALDRIHRSIILPLNDGAFQQLRDAALGQAPRLAAQKAATNQGKAAFNALEVPIRELEQDIAAFTQRLRR